ncbi:aldehyde dehydrogenase family protein [Gandjariella thermophila]|uniref:Aldehyde dehydrogenase n=1 Tax=Gandjariella thermophila TaxID=1931992 RepID=A0A4D4J873_9PSEU|nr:aldehyde dehydrogenase family protein [Gandjariella thermophila]GDY31724.1 aldehyde dehydrogenase [Gandjariella thermophila]
MTGQLSKETAAATTPTFDLTNPATGELVGTYPVHTAEDVAEVVARSREAARWWAGLGSAERRRRLIAWTRWLAEHSDEMCELGFQETGKPRGDVQFELVASLEDIKWAAKNAERVLKPRRVGPGAAMMNFAARLEYLPLGVAGIITPWNFPLYTPFCGMAYALAAGNGVVVKPSELSTATGVYAVESFARANPDAPDGLVGWVSGFGETGAALCRSGVDKIAFTGSVPTGRRVMAACADNLVPVLLELGGKDAAVVAADADLDAAADAVVWGGYWHAGQACVGVERVYVVEAVRDAFLRRVRERVEKLTVGLDELSDYGPMTMPGQIEIVRRHVTDALERGGTALVGGLESIKPPYIYPIVLVDVPEESSAVREETFGPVLVINTVPDTDEAVRRANATNFGLASSVFSAAHGPEIAAKLRAGGTTINSVMTFVGIPSLPFGGVGDSGFGRFHGDDGLREFSRPKATTRKRFSIGKEMQAFPRTREQFTTVRRVLKLRFARRWN